MNPEILTQPNIPKPLHGLSPREIMGADWWNFTREETKQLNNGLCDACGTHRSNDPYHRWLEAHEQYKIHYKRHTSIFKGVVLLCHSCHNFIHSGYLYTQYQNNEITKDKIVDILSRGFNILRRKRLKPFISTYCIAELLGVNIKNIEPWSPPEDRGNNWSKWILLFEGKKYPGKFKDFIEWEKFYQNKKIVLD